MAYIDCLGFEQKVIDSATDRNLIASLRLLHFQIATGLPVNALMLDFQKLQFSDTLVLSTTPSIEGLWFLIQLVRGKAFNVLHLGLLFRGGIAIGPMIHDGSMAFGPAYLEAYRLESRIAIHPRIVLSRRAVEMAHAAAVRRHSGWEREYLNKYLRRDDDGIVYVEIFDDPATDPTHDMMLDDQEMRAGYVAMFADLARTVEREMSRAIANNRLDIYAKYRWFAIKQNHHVRRIAERTGANVDVSLVRLQDDDAPIPSAK